MDAKFVIYTSWVATKNIMLWPPGWNNQDSSRIVAWDSSHMLSSKTASNEISKQRNVWKTRFGKPHGNLFFRLRLWDVETGQFIWHSLSGRINIEWNYPTTQGNSNNDHPPKCNDGKPQIGGLGRCFFSTRPFFRFQPLVFRGVSTFILIWTAVLTVWCSFSLQGLFLHGNSAKAK